MGVIKINKYIIKPLSSKKENFYLLLSFVVLLSLAAVLLRMRYKPHYKQEIHQNEISAFNDLDSIEASIYSDLLNSVVDISILKGESAELPDISLLEKEEIPPFYKDKVWEQRGALEWDTFSHDNENFYIGISSNSEIGSFVLKINEKDIEKSEIFYTKERFPKKDILKNFDKYENIFKKVVPYTGENERKKFKEE